MMYVKEGFWQDLILFPVMKGNWYKYRLGSDINNPWEVFTPDTEQQEIFHKFPVS